MKMIFKLPIMSNLRVSLDVDCPDKQKKLWMVERSSLPPNWEIHVTYFLQTKKKHQRVGLTCICKINVERKLVWKGPEGQGHHIGCGCYYMNKGNKCPKMTYWQEWIYVHSSDQWVSKWAKTHSISIDKGLLQGYLIWPATCIPYNQILKIQVKLILKIPNEDNIGRVFG